MSINVPVSAIILAAGESKRMGIPKQLMPIGGTTMLGKVLDALLCSQAEEIIVVVGHKAEEVVKTISGKPVKVAFNRYYEQGMSTSIISGLNLVDKRAQAVMIALADQPLISNRIIDKLLEEFRKQDKGIVMPIYRGRRGHPVIFSLKYKNELLKLKGDVGGRQLIDRHLDDVFEVLVDSEYVNIDVDTLDDYAQLA